MEEKINIYTWLLVKKDGTWDKLWSKSIKKPPCGEPDLLEWVEWNKPLPEDIDTLQYKYNAETSELESI